MSHKSQKALLAVVSLAALGLTACRPLPIFSTDDWGSTGTATVTSSNPASQGSVSRPTGTGKTDASYSPAQKAFNTIGKASLPSLGKPRVLVVPVAITDFPDAKGVISGFSSDSHFSITFNDGTSTDARVNWPDAIQKGFFGSADETGWESLTSFYEKSSYGKLQIDGAVAPVFHTKKTYSQIQSDLKGTKGDAAIKEETDDIAKDIYDAYFTGEDAIYDLDDFDANGDGCIDALWMVYDVPQSELYDYEEDNVNSLFWAYTTAYDSENDVIPNPSENHISSYAWASKFFLAEGALFAKEPYKSSSGWALSDMHTMIHETGHLMGLADYYDTSADSQRSPAGALLMMDHNVYDHDPFSKYLLGWIDPKRVKLSDVANGNVDLTLKPFESSGDALIVDLPGNTGWIGEQYYILSYWTPTGLNEKDATNEYNYLEAQKGKIENPYFGYTKAGIQVYKVDGRFGVLKNAYADPSTGTVATESEFESAGSDEKIFQSFYTNSSSKADIDKDDVILELTDAQKNFKYLQTTAYQTPSSDVMANDSTLFHEGDVLDSSYLGKTNPEDDFVVSFHGKDGSPDASVTTQVKVIFKSQSDSGASLTVSKE